jgi:parallel beta-helix repeat protein
MTNCRIYNNLGFGLRLISVHNISVDRLTIQNNSWFGIYIGERGENITVHYSKILNNSPYGIYILDETVKGRHLHSIRNILIHNNTIANNGGGNLSTNDGGIIIYQCIKRVIIQDNNITSNKGYGVYFSRSWNNKVMKNNFINNTEHASFSYFSLWNKWQKNYWDDWIGFGPKCIKGKLGDSVIPWFNFDWHPAQEPYDL